MSGPMETYKTHTKFNPPFHFVVLPVLLLNVLFMGYHAVTDFDIRSVWALLMGVALFGAALFGRVFALKVQDRVIRLEERIRLRELLPPDLRDRINEFTIEQLIGLRFASDAELPDLSRAVLRDNIQRRDAIKKMVQHWRGDSARA